MSIFADTMLKAISDYRSLLRRHLDQADRVRKLNALKIRGNFYYENDVDLYTIGYSIIKDIERSFSHTGRGYYAYSGVRRFSDHLKEYLDQYIVIDSTQVIHCGQHSAKSLLSAIQLISLPASRLSRDADNKLRQLIDIIFNYGTEKQQIDIMGALELGLLKAEDFFGPLFAYAKTFLGEEWDEKYDEVA